MKLIVIFVILCASSFSCKNTAKSEGATVKEDSKTIQSPDNRVKYVRSISFSSPIKDSVYKRNSRVPVDISHRRGNLDIDSLCLYVDGQLKKVMYHAPYRCYLNFKDGKVGRRSIKAIAYHKNNKRGVVSTKITVLPDKEPSQYGYKVIKVYKHDTKAFTQGLVYDAGYLYEGTGQYGESSIRKIDLKNDQIVSVLNIDRKYFGEGITIYDGKIIQLTWNEMTAFVYDLKSFTKESEFHYSTQGWGITTMDNELVMSDGSHKLYVLEPDSFYVKEEIEVFDNNGKVDSLNELEYINGKIYANIWTKDKIVIIDPKTGAVDGEINLEGLLTKNEKRDLDPKDDVLNGIAYDHHSKRLFVTGKRWPKLFQIEIYEK